MRWMVDCGVVCLCACGPASGDADGEGDGGSDASTNDDPSASETGGVGEESGGADSLTHDVIKVDFVRSESQDSNPFVGTTNVMIVMDYRDCLQEFYSNNPSMRQDGLEGARVFGTLADGGEGWVDRLCDGSSEHIECEVESITQQLDVGTPRLIVVYAITGDLELEQLMVGPFPKTELAACQGDSLPELGLGSAKGTDGNADVWTTEAFDPTRAVVGQKGPITIYARLAD